MAASTTFSTIDDPALIGFADEIGGPEAGPVAVVGRRTRWTVGGPGDGDARLVKAPSGVVEYTPAEMTVTARAGSTVAELDEALAANGQRCALPDRGGTVGGAIAVGEDRVDAAGTGRVRTSVLRVRYVSAEGRLITGGGATVKNVTGFDLPRLLTGSLGTLGCIAEVTLRTNPIPEVSRWLHAPEADPLTVRNALYRPSALLSRAGEVWVLLEGHGADVEAQVGVLGGLGRFRDTDGPPDLPPHRWSLTPAQTLSAEIDGTGDDPVASVLSGIVFAAQPQPRRSVSTEEALLMERIKNSFDPTGRLNPGRTLGRY